MTFRYIAWQNVRRQWHDYTAYLFATAFSVLIFFVFVSLYFHPQFNQIAADDSRVGALFMVSAILVGLFSMLFLWYSSSLFFSKRNREVGTWMLLGMKKREAARILYLESMLVGVVALAVGIALGLLLRRLFLLLLIRLMGTPMQLQVQIDVKPIAITVAIFLVLFALGGISGIMGVLRYELIRLFREEQRGEEHPRFATIQAILAVATIAAGYGMAALPSESTSLTQLGIILVITIIGTFLLFGGAWYVAFRNAKRRRAVAADAVGMVSAGQILFRVKKNAKFLALVAVLNAVAITAVGTMLTFREERDLFFGSYSNAVPFDFDFLAESEGQVSALVGAVREIDPGQQPDGAYAEVIVPREPLAFSDSESVDGLISVSVYRRLGDVRPFASLPVVPTGNEVVLVARVRANASHIVGATLTAVPDGDPLTIISVVDDTLLDYNRVPGGYVGVVSDATFAALRPVFAGERPERDAMTGDRRGGILQIGVIDVAQPRRAWKLLEMLDTRLNSEADLSGAVATFVAVNGITGILLFVGGFIGIMLVLSNGSIIFFRQLMEAHESRDRFDLLHKIGFTQSDLRRTIVRGQLSLFGAPYLVGLIHAFFALFMLARLIDIPTVGAHIAISIVYAAIYAAYIAVNARVYERIVAPTPRPA